MTVADRKRKALRDGLDALQALAVFAGNNNATTSREWDELRGTIDDLTRRNLDHNLAVVEAELDRTKRVLLPTRPFEFYVDYVNDVREFLAPEERMFLARWELEALFKGIQAAIPALAILPQHATLSLDVHGTGNADDVGEVRLIEASLFEDMCALFNRAWALTAILGAETREPRAMSKEATAMRRSTILSAFYVIESYLNSIAFDYLIAHAGDSSTADLDRIAEWNHEKQRAQLVAFRDKLIHYPRIILGLRHPPLQENNCPEIKFILDEAKAFRDAIVHANPRPDPFSPRSGKELRFWRAGSATPVRHGNKRNPQHAEAEAAATMWMATVDNTITLIEKIETLIHGNCERLYWLQHRRPDGQFDETVFA